MEKNHLYTTVQKITTGKNLVIRYTENLPIFAKREEILHTLSSHQVIVVTGAAGSGKTTQLPLFCLEAGRGGRRKIGCTQPRRIAATSIAARAAEQLGCALGKEVGYKIRFSDRDSPDTFVKYMTDGILLAEIERDPDLVQYDTLIIDEAHERSLNIDFLLGYLRKLVQRRSDLKVLISSATIDTELFSKAFGNAPVIEVSGQLFPVETVYRREDGPDDASYADQAVTAVKDCIDTFGEGDMLVFMPTERDIHETSHKLIGAHLDNTVVLPLFSRLSRAEQELIFKSIRQRKIVVATNIAETSITVPGIRFVVDTGLARISRYAPRLRTSRLPVEPVSRASADQRKGRCGRVREGVCIRLYSEEDYLAREEFTQPEILRSNLAGIILTMVAHKMGPIEEFPFLDSPSMQAVNDGYAMLWELGAIDQERKLTPLGREMSQLPLDPQTARMVIEARKENALREVKIIAAGLSIVDPRERPLDKQAEADAMHRPFIDPASDFLTLLNIWDSYREQWKQLKTRNRVRKFCRDNFLSCNRMQEWHDIYQQLNDTLLRMNGFHENRSKPSYEAIHKSLLSGLITNCAVKEDNGRYRTSRGREIIIFPGSSLAKKGPLWIVCQEIVETSQVFARTVAGIEPEWIETVAPHLIKKTYDEPFFDPETGFVRATERASLYGLTVAERKNTNYGPVNPELAARVFIRQALVEQNMRSGLGFHKHNCAVKAKLENAEAKLRVRKYYAGDDALEAFYRKRLGNTCSVRDLQKLIRQKGNDRFLYISEDDFLTEPLAPELEEYPDEVTIAGKRFPLRYTFDPGSEQDGVTMQVDRGAVPFIAEKTDWLLPALWPARIRDLLRALPKELRKEMMPIHERADELAAALKAGSEPFNTALSKAIMDLYKVKIDPAKLDSSRISPHLDMKIEVHDEKGAIIARGRAPDIFRDASHPEALSSSEWQDLFKQYERRNLTSWPDGDIPENIKIDIQGSVPLYGYPALKSGVNSVDLIIFARQDEARQCHINGIEKLLEIVLDADLAWADRELRCTGQLKLLCAPFGGFDKVKSAILSVIRNSFINTGCPAPRKKEEFMQRVEEIRSNLKNIGYETLSLIETIFSTIIHNRSLIDKEKRGTLTEIRKELKKDLSAYIDRITGGIVTFTEFRQYPRYLKAFGYRIQRAFIEPMKYKEKRAELGRWEEKVNTFVNKRPDLPESSNVELRMMLEEYGISLFAQQEVKTMYPVSMKRLDNRMSELSSQ